MLTDVLKEEEIAVFNFQCKFTKVIFDPGEKHQIKH